MQPPEALSPPETIQTPPRQAGMLTLLRRDRALQGLLAIAFFVNIALLAFLIIRFDAIPDPLPLHFDASGLPDRIDAKNGILQLPAIGSIVFLLNATLGMLVHRRERAASLLLAAGALLVQILMWLAALNIAGGLI